MIALLLALSVHAHAALNPGMANRLASLQSEGEGTVVTEALVRRGDHPGTELSRRLKAITTAAIPFLDASVKEAPWNDSHMGIEGPSCFDAAPKLGLLLRALRLPGWVAAAGHHVFLVVEAPEATLIIDPTIHQYFGQNSAPAWVPKVFVGTYSELKALYARDPGLPVLPFQRIYFDPEWSASRRDSKMLSVRSKVLHQQSSREYAPLVDFLNRNSR